MADYLHRLSADDPFWDHVNKELDENEAIMEELAKKRRIARKRFFNKEDAK